MGPLKTKPPIVSGGRGVVKPKNESRKLETYQCIAADRYRVMSMSADATRRDTARDARWLNARWSRHTGAVQKMYSGLYRKCTADERAVMNHPRPGARRPPHNIIVCNPSNKLANISHKIGDKNCH
jgi:hypothetical protein